MRLEKTQTKADELQQEQTGDENYTVDKCYNICLMWDGTHAFTSKERTQIEGGGLTQR